MIVKILSLLLFVLIPIILYCCWVLLQISLPSFLFFFFKAFLAEFCASLDSYGTEVNSWKQLKARLSMNLLANDMTCSIPKDSNEDICSLMGTVCSIWGSATNRFFEWKAFILCIDPRNTVKPQSRQFYYKMTTRNTHKNIMIMKRRNKKKNKKKTCLFLRISLWIFEQKRIKETKNF